MSYRRPEYSDSEDDDSMSSDDGRRLYDEEKPSPAPAPPPQKSSGLMWAIVGLIIVILLAVGVGLAIHFDLFGGGDSLASASSAGSAGGQVTVKETVTAQPTNAAGATTKPSAGGAAPTRSSGGEDDQEEPSRGGGGGHTATGGGSDEEPGEPEETGHGTKPAGTKTAAGSSPTSTGGGGSPPAPGSAEYSTMEVPVPDGATGLAISFASASGDAAGFLEQNGMAISSYSVTAEPIPHTFDKENVVIQDGILQLIVKGGGSDSVSSSEVATTFNMKYGMITTRARATKVKGVCHGFFFYLSDEAEIDIEILTSYITEGLENGIPAGLEFTNHGSTSTNKYVDYPADPAVDFHNYSTLWTESSTSFYFDGEFMAEITENVPQVAGPWIWNSWSSGDPQWSAGPPDEDNILEIESIGGYYYPE